MIRAEISYTKEHFAALSDKKSKMSPIQVFGLVFFAAAATLVCILSLANGKKPDVVSVVMAVVLWAAFALYCWLRYISSPERLYKIYCRDFPDAKIKVAFDDDGFILKSVSAVSETENLSMYSAISGAYERNDFFVMNLSGGAVIIGHSEITEGTPDDLRALLTARLGDKFRQQ